MNLFVRLALVVFILIPSSGVWSQTVITAGAGNINANTVGSYVLNTGDTRSNTGGTEVVSIGSATVGTYELTVNGTITQTGTGRGIRSSNNNVTFSITVGTSGIIQAAGEDAVQIRNGTVNLTNNGQILALYSGIPSANSGQALDMTSAIGGTVNNGSSTNTSALIQANGHDAVRLGSNMILNNYGSIIGNSTVNDNAANNNSTYNATNTYSTSEGVSFENGSNSTLNNYGTITGTRHGVESDTNALNITINNYANGSIVGKNGSGIGFDATSGTVTNVIIDNYGLIRGDYAGAGNVIDRSGSASPNNDGDGDGIDIDGAVTIINRSTGQILSTGAGGFDSSGRANNSEAVAIGGGNITNYGIIRGASRAILVNNDANADRTRSGVAATTIINYGTIEGQSGYGIRLENKLGTAADNDRIENYGTIIGTGAIPDPSAIVTRQYGEVDNGSGAAAGTLLDGVTYTGTGSARFIRGDGSTVQMGEGDDVLINSGTITSTNGRAVNMEGGSDAVTINKGSVIIGSVNGGAGTDTLTININGLTDAKKAQLAAGGTVYVGGIEFTGFEAVSAASTSVTYTSLSKSSATAGVARAIDNSTGTATSDFRALLNKVDSAVDPDGALRELTPSTQQVITNILLDSSTQVTSLTNNRLGAVRSGGPQFDSSGLRVWDATMDRAMQQTQYLLAGTAMDSKALSDSPKQMAVPTVALPEAQRWGFFANGNAVFAEQGATAQLQKSDYTTAAATIGADYRITENFVFGAYGGYSYTDAKLDGAGSTSKIDTGLVGIYSTYYRDNWFLDSSFGYGRSYYENDRKALGTSNTSTPQGDQFNFQNRLGYDFKVQQWTLTPLLGAQFTKTVVEAYNESGSAAVLQVREDEADSFRSSLGGQVQYAWATSWGTLTPQWRASWIHEFLNDSRDISSQFVNLSNTAFTTSTANPDRDFAVLGCGLSANFAQKWTTSLDYDLEVGRQEFVAHQINAGIRYSF